MNTPSFRRVAVVTGSLTAVGALALTCAVSAQAAPTPNAIAKLGSQATALAASIHLGGGIPPLKTPALAAVWSPGDPAAVTKTTSTSTVLPGQSLLSAGVAAGTVTVRKTQSNACSGILASGGTLQVGGGTSCTALSPGSSGVKIDLSSLLTKLPIGVGGLSITATGITANATYNAGVTGGLGTLINGAISVCLGVTLNGACVGVPLTVPLAFSGAKNEDVLPVIVNALSTNPQLREVGKKLTALLSPVAQIRANVQGLNGTTGVRTVVGLQVKLLQGGLITNFASATAGPRNV